MEQAIFEEWKQMNNERNTLYASLPARMRVLSISVIVVILAGPAASFCAAAFHALGLSAIPLGREWALVSAALSVFGCLCSALLTWHLDNVAPPRRTPPKAYYAQINAMLKKHGCTSLATCKAICDALTTRAVAEVQTAERFLSFGSNTTVALLFVAFVEMMHQVFADALPAIAILATGALSFVFALRLAYVLFDKHVVSADQRRRCTSDLMLALAVS